MREVIERRPDRGRAGARPAAANADPAQVRAIQRAYASHGNQRRQGARREGPCRPSRHHRAVRPGDGGVLGHLVLPRPHMDHLSARPGRRRPPLGREPIHCSEHRHASWSASPIPRRARWIAAWTVMAVLLAGTRVRPPGGRGGLAVRRGRPDQPGRRHPPERRGPPSPSWPCRRCWRWPPTTATPRSLRPVPCTVRSRPATSASRSSPARPPRLGAAQQSRHRGVHPGRRQGRRVHHLPQQPL